MSIFDDWEPEDSWDRSDDPEIQMENLRRRVVLLFLHNLPPIDTLEEIAEAVRQARARGDFTPRDELRANDLDDDITFMRGRV